MGASGLFIGCDWFIRTCNRPRGIFSSKERWEMRYNGVTRVSMHESTRAIDIENAEILGKYGPS